MHATCVPFELRAFFFSQEIFVHTMYVPWPTDNIGGLLRLAPITKILCYKNLEPYGKTLQPLPHILGLIEKNDYLYY